jgi:hypothetical protein
MNILILTPDAVGSTLLQRVLTIYMQFNQFDQPVINLHELTNGLQKYYSPEFNREIIHRRGKYGYYQTLSEVVNLLESVDHYKTARLAQYHIRQRHDVLADQLPFYKYLDENFYIIACRRQNLFEHAISHAFNSVTKKLNVYSAQEKIFCFYQLYCSGVEIDQTQILSAMNRYRDYLSWADCHFNIGSYFYYEKHLQNIESYILNLPMFAKQHQTLTWKENFNIEFEQWNRCHFYTSDLGALHATKKDLLTLNDTNQIKHNVTLVVQKNLPDSHQEFLQEHNREFRVVNTAIKGMMQLGILPSAVPIKKQTLKEKLSIVRNLAQCVDTFNSWVEKNPGIAAPTTIENLFIQAQLEYNQQWSSSGSLTNQSPAVLPIVQ